MEQGNWVPLDKKLVEALPRERPYTLVEAAFSYQVDLDNKVVKSLRGYSRIWGWSMTKVTNFIKNTKTTKTERAKNTREAVKFRWVKAPPRSERQAKDKRKTGKEWRGDITKYPKPIHPYTNKQFEGGRNDGTLNKYDGLTGSI